MRTNIMYVVEYADFEKHSCPNCCIEAVVKRREFVVYKDALAWAKQFCGGKQFNVLRETRYLMFFRRENKKNRRAL